MCRGTHIHTLLYLAYIPMSEQGQLPKSAAIQEGFFGFQERTNKMTQWDTVCSDSNRDDAGRYKKVQRQKTEALQLTVSFVACSMVQAAPASEDSTYILQCPLKELYAGIIKYLWPMYRTRVWLMLGEDRRHSATCVCCFPAGSAMQLSPYCMRMCSSSCCWN